jgi:KipI family sensor histidine kinase inhibitor
MRFVPASDTSLLVVVDESETPSLDASAKVHALFRAIESSRDDHVLGSVVDMHPGYTTLLVDFDARAVRSGFDDVVAAIRDCASAYEATAAQEAAALAAGPRTQEVRELTLEVDYDGEDLDFVAAHAKRSVDEVIALHTAATYTVAFLGFAPGFAYLLGLDEKLATPRLATPRPKVRPGSVAIGGTQTAVYPSSSPGGWRIIGHVERVLAADWAAPGDRVRFRCSKS